MICSHILIVLKMLYEDVTFWKILICFSHALINFDNDVIKEKLNVLTPSHKTIWILNLGVT